MIRDPDSTSLDIFAPPRLFYGRPAKTSISGMISISQQPPDEA
jgi:hypothetical protein